MERSEGNESKFTRYWYQLMWAIDDLEQCDDSRWDYEGSQGTKVLLKDALSRLESSMDKKLVTEFRRGYRLKVAGASVVRHK